MKKNKTVNIALIGNQNCGKTTFFNAVTGKTGKTGNFPGVTVEKTFGYIKKNRNFKMYDLPGLYSLSALTEEEKITGSFLKSDEVDIIFNIVDSTNLSRNLFLTFQLAKLNKPMIVIFNMADELRRYKMSLDTEKFSRLTGILCTSVSARKGVDVNSILTLADLALSVPFKCNTDYSTEREIYSLIDGICISCLNGQRTNLTDKSDRILLNRFLAFPIFTGIMVFIFTATFSFANDFASYFYERLSDLLYRNIDIKTPIMMSFVRDGLVKGTVSVLSFLPVVLVLFFFLSLLEDSGYMARISFITDKLMKKAGLSGKAFFPVIMAFGCSVPSVMATRTLSCQCEKKCTMKLIPFISCSAKLPVYIYICNLFFRDFTPFIILTLYIFSAVSGFIVVFAHKNESDFILELPPYRMPTFKSTLSLMFERTKEFLRKVFTVIVFVSVAIWALSNFDFSLCATSPDNSMLGIASKKLEFLFSPIGLGDFRIISSLICGIGAKEAILSALSVLSAENIFTPLSAVSFMIFVLLYTPCISALATIKKESKSLLFTLKIALFQFVFAWCASFIFYSISLPFFS